MERLTLCALIFFATLLGSTFVAFVNDPPPIFVMGP